MPANHPLAMKPLLFVYQLFVVAPVILGQPFGSNLADLFTPDGWTASAPGVGIGFLILLGWTGILITIVGYRLFDQSIRDALPQKTTAPADDEAAG